ncbi:MAG: hypothetical protein IPK82_42285 [Polyangiaceae bacterium]|nr:hypothetical protein [Polyangiaceae bacterium]
MKKWLAAVVIMGGPLAFGFLGCDGGGSQPTCPPSSASASAVQAAPLTTGRPQSPRYHAGIHPVSTVGIPLDLESVDYFVGSIDDFKTDVTPDGTATPTAVFSSGERRKLTVEWNGKENEKDKDPCAKSADGKTTFDVPLYSVKVKIGGTTFDLCGNEIWTAYEDADLSQCEIDSRALLSQKAIAIPGRWNRTSGKYEENCNGKGCFTLACTTGVAAKCAHWGYVPGQKYNEKDMLPYYKACVHAARAHYADDGVANTCTFTVADFFDNAGFQKRDRDPNTWNVEAVWDENGLVCFNRPRWQGCRGPIDKKCDSKLFNNDGFTGDAYSTASVIGITSLTSTNTDNECVSDANYCPSK